MEGMLGYPIDTFQQSALTVLLTGDDVLGMAPTGSGKTVLALMAMVLRAFDAGKRVIYTSPIKALSNQKYSEFSSCLGKLYPGGERRVSLLTGDIQARACAPGGDGKSELLIMTNEILSNKLELLGEADDDLKDVSVVVMDEVHYINDPERGASWEKAMMLLPRHIQTVALSATLKDPIAFSTWMCQRRPTQVVQRRDRHVPLDMGMYVGCDAFTCLHTTHSDTSLSSAAYVSCCKAFSKERNPTASTLVSRLEACDHLPAIAFVLSRAACVKHAHSIERNLLIPPRPVKAKDQDEYDFEWQIEQHMDTARGVRRRQDELYRKHLLRFQKDLEAIPGYVEFKEMLDRGVAYHHAGMLPVLREYVEILFQSKLIKVVFATETLGVGLNMPARCVVFTQLNKPTGRDVGGLRPLRTEEYWQMAGRAGRRGMDIRGFVAYYPLQEKPVEFADLHDIMLGSLTPVTSQIRIDALTVLRMLRRGGSLEETLLRHQLKKECNALLESIKAIPLVLSPEEESRLEEYIKYEERLSRSVGFIKLTPKQGKEAQARMRQIQNTFGDRFIETIRIYKERRELSKQLASTEKYIDESVEQACVWLQDAGMLATDTGKLLTKGLVCSSLSEGMPLVRGSSIFAGQLDDATMQDAITWLAGFSDQLKVNDATHGNDIMHIPIVSDTVRTLDTDYMLATAEIMNVWLQAHDIRALTGLLGFQGIGSFVKAVMRTLSFVEDTRKVLLDLGKFELYNRLEGFKTAMLSGVVTNMSLYVGQRS
jgi:superfamily II RNA helicase